MTATSLRVRARALFLAAAPLAAGACGAQPAAPEFAVLSGAANAPSLPVATTPPEDLPGVDSDDLSDREKGAWWQLVTQLYAPCAEQAVSIQQCVKEERACRACKPAAQLLAQKLHEGLSPADAQAAYAARFGPNKKPAEPLDSPARGPADAPVSIVVWSDFQCPACRFAMPLLDAALEKFSGKVRLVHKFYPLRMHNFAEGAARAAIAAKNQGKYWEMERLLFEHQSALADSDLEKYARELGLDMGRWHADLRSPKTDAVLARDRGDADVAGLAGTPFIIINGREFDSAYFRSDTELEGGIEVELERAGAR